MTTRCQTALTRSNQVSMREQRIHRWVHKEPSSTDSAFFPADRLLSINLFQLGQQREKLIERHNYEQKLFANKQAIRHKENESVLNTLNYVRKCCQYSDMSDIAEEAIDPTMFLEENSAMRSMRARTVNANAPKIKRNSARNTTRQLNNPLAEVFLRHNKKHIKPAQDITPSKTPLAIQSTENDDNQQRHVQFQSNTERNIQSAHISSKVDSSNETKRSNRNITSAHGLLTYQIPMKNSIPSTISVDRIEEQIKPTMQAKRSPSRAIPSKSSLPEFRQHPERFLSQSNRYLPLLRRQAMKTEAQESYFKQQKEKNDVPKKSRTQLGSFISPLADGSDLVYDDARSFLSEEVDAGKYVLQPSNPVADQGKTRKKVHAPSKIDLMETTVIDTSERTMALSHLRDREYAHLHKLVHAKPIEHILEPLSTMKTSINKQQRARCLNEILHSIDSLRCSTTLNNHKRRQSDIDKNRSKLGILIF